MKKLFVLIALIGFGFSANAQKTVKLNVVTNVYECFCKGRGACTALRFDSNGRISFEDLYNGYPTSKGPNYGKYYIDSENVIRITWDNGLQETAQLSYQSDGRAIVHYNRYTLYEFRTTDCG